jgi:hypothetical protein
LRFYVVEIDTCRCDVDDWQFTTSRTIVKLSLERERERGESSVTRMKDGLRLLGICFGDLRAELGVVGPTGASGIVDARHVTNKVPSPSIVSHYFDI